MITPTIAAESAATTSSVAEAAEGDVTITEAARILEIGRNTVYRLIDEGRLNVWRNPIYKVPTKGVRIPRAQVLRLRELTRPSA